MNALLSRPLRTFALLAAVFGVSACGGRHADTQATTSPSSQTPPPVVLPTTSLSGVFDGTLTDSGLPATAILESDGSYYVVYAGSDLAPAGAIIGNGASNNGSFASTDAADLSLIGTGSQTPDTGTLSGSLDPGKSFKGTVTYASQKLAVAFSTAYNNAFTTLPTLASMAGTYTGAIATRTLKEDKLQLTIAADGTVSGKLSCGCSITATLKPRNDNSAYIATLQFTGGSHPLTNKSLAGDVYFDAAKKRIYVVGNVSGTEGALFVGTRQ